MRLPPFLIEQKPPADPDLTARMQRRHFMRRIGSSALLAAPGLPLAACRSAETSRTDPLSVRFAHGVASGDPLADRVILWTRVTPHDPDEARALDVRWQLASDRAMQNIVASGSAATGPEHDYTVKVDALGLQPGQVYFYRFAAAAALSPVGRTKTLPQADITHIRLAVFSCANYPSGYFNVYADAARQDDLDAVLHIGDYIYEYDSAGYGCEHAAALGRISEPVNTLLVLADYRRRYAQYRSDPDLQALHAGLPFIAVWDDHEFADDAWRDGAVDHKAASDGPFSHRKAAAIRAYHEWMPLRAPDARRPEQIYRSFDFGRLVSLHMLDTRIVGRDQQLMMSSYFGEDERFDAAKFKADVHSPRRQLLGAQQMAWLERQIAGSQAAWQILGQQVLMARMEYPTAVALGELSCAQYAALQRQARREPAGLTPQQQALLAAPTLPCYMDSWDGYQHEREKVFAMMARHDKNLVVLAGDTHNAWASDLLDRAQRQIGVEFATASVSSPGLECRYPDQDPAHIARMMEQLIAPLYYAQTGKRGYLIITATADAVRADWRFVNTVQSRQFSAATERSLRTVAGLGNRRIVEAAA